jgi:membrane-bound lytic murein transglycosylase A
MGHPRPAGLDEPAHRALVAAAQHNLRAVRPPKAGATGNHYGNLVIPQTRVLRSAHEVAAALRTGKSLAAVGLRAYLSHGEDRQGNVHFTGYFTPQLRARRQADPAAGFRYPIYRLPRELPKPGPTREAIDHQGALAGRGLELAWTDDLLELYFLHVQGSGQLLFEDGTRQPIGYAGQNGRAYTSLGRFLVERGSIPADKISLRAIRDWMRRHPEELIPLLNRNPSYTFFTCTQHGSRGAANVDLVPFHSVAADRGFFPMGACLLAEVPVLDPATGKLAGHTYRLLFVHDTGGAIRGPGHLDLYHGVGPAAGDAAGDLHHYGRVWMLLTDEAP